jgi:hypothetical protein
MQKLFFEFAPAKVTGVLLARFFALEEQRKLAGGNTPEPAQEKSRPGRAEKFRNLVGRAIATLVKSATAAFTPSPTP